MEDRDQTGSAAPVFLSYSRADQEAALPIINALLGAGINVWWDGLIEGGAKFSTITEQALENAPAVVVLWSTTSIESHWVKDEATRGRDRNRLVPVSIDGSEPPLGFRQFQCLDLPSKAAKAGIPEFDRLVNSILALQDSSFVPQASQATPPTNRGLSRRMALLGGGVAILGAGGLAAWFGGIVSASARENSVAVLPFITLGADERQNYFADGLATEIRARLARNPLLKVSAQASSRAARESGGDVRAICNKLGVAFMLDGSVRQVGGRVRILAELIEGANGERIWSDEYDQLVDDIFAIERAISAGIAQALTEQIEGATDEQIGGTKSVAAYEAYLQGRELYDAGIDESSDRQALAKFDQAIAIDPDYAAAHVGRSRSLGIIGNLYGTPEDRPRLYGEAVAAGTRAIKLAPKLADAHLVLGFALANGELDFASAREPYEQAYILGGGDADVLSRYAIFRSRSGDFETAEKAISLSTSLDPLNARTFRFAGDIAYGAGKYDSALELFRKAKSIQDGLSSYHFLVGLVHLETGDLAAAKQSFAQERRSIFKQTGLAIVEHRIGNEASAQANLAMLKSENGDSSSYQYAQIYAQWGMKQEALAALADAWELRDSGLTQMYNDPLMAPIRDEPAFRDIAGKIGFAA